MKKKSCSRVMEAIESLEDNGHRHRGWILLGRHVRRCPDCGAYLARMESIIEALDGIQPVSAPDEFLEAVMGRLVPRLLRESTAVEERSHGHRGLLVLAGAAGLGVAVAVTLAVWRRVVGQQGEEELASIGTA